MKTRDIIVLAIVLALAGILLVCIFFMNSSSQGEQSNVSASTSVCDDNIVTDADGNTYDVVKIGEQVWMKSNLRTTHYADGTEIERTTTCKENEPRYYKDEETGEIYYNSYAAMKNICPDGWHVSSIADWQKLEDYLVRDGRYTCGKIETQVAKSLAASTEEWRSSDRECAPGYNPRTTNNISGFSALPMGKADYEDSKNKAEISWRGGGAFFVVSDDNRYRSDYLDFGKNEFKKSIYILSGDGEVSYGNFFACNLSSYCESVRCVRDEQ